MFDYTLITIERKRGGQVYEIFCRIVGRHKIAANEQGLLQGWYFIMSSPEPRPNNVTKDEVTMLIKG